MQLANAEVCFEQQAASAAGVICNAVVLDSIRVLPVQIVRDREMGGEDRALGARVVSGQRLPIADEALENRAGNVVVV